MSPADELVDVCRSLRDEARFVANALKNGEYVDLDPLDTLVETATIVLGKWGAA